MFDDEQGHTARRCVRSHPDADRQPHCRPARRDHAWRRDIHAHPELLYDVHRTAATVADKLRSFG
jgi:hypothetical protein